MTTADEDMHMWLGATPDDLLQVDAANREIALDTSQSFCVSAPAGSGKTELLTQRFLALLARVDQPEKVLAMTFTRKAAAEMRERVISALELGVQTTPPDETHKLRTYQLAQVALANDAAHDWRLLENPSRCRIQTIDSVTQSIALDQPITNQFGGGLRAVDDAKPLYQAATESLLRELLSEHDHKKRVTDLKRGALTHDELSDIEQVLAYLDNDLQRLNALFVQMLSVRNQWLPHAAGLSDSDVVAQLDQVLRRWMEDIFAQLRELISGRRGTVASHVASDLALCADFAGSFFSTNDQGKRDELIESLAGINDLPAADLDNHKQWMGIATILLTKEFSYRRSINVKQGFPAKSDKQYGERSEQYKNLLSDIVAELSNEAEIAELLKSVLMLPLQGYHHEHKAILQPLANCLVRLTAHLNIVFAEGGQCDHNEMAMRAIRALDQEQNLVGDTRYRWGYQLHHLLVDEFQDTSVAQYELIELLLAEWQVNNEQQPQSPKTLFVVGDGMQSIYSFREAKVGLFLAIKQNGIAGLPVRPLALLRNFRSTLTVVDWINHHFTSAFPTAADLALGAVPYTASIGAQPSASDSDCDNVSSSSCKATHTAVSVIGFANQSDRLAEAEQVVAQIKQSLKEDAGQQIAILVRARSHIGGIITALDQAGIDWQGVDLDLLKKREVVVDCLSLTRALLNPVDDIAWYALLRAPWCGLRLVDMQAIADFLSDKNIGLAELLSDATLAAQHREAIAQRVSADGMQRLTPLMNVLANAFASRARNRLRVWIESTWRALDGELLARFDEGAKCLSAAQSESYIAVQTFFTLLEDLEQELSNQGRELTLVEIERRVESIYAPLKPATSTDRKPVQIMTIHKAKGLEFDTVILPSLDRSPPASDKPLLMVNQRLFSHGGSGTLLYPIVKSPMLARDANKKAFSVYDYLREQDKRTRDFESTRLLYVAATRAKRRLMLMANVKLDENGNLKQPSKGSLLAKLWRTISPEMSIVDGEQYSIANRTDNEDSEEPRYRQLKRQQLSWITDRESRLVFAENHVSVSDTPGQAGNEAINQSSSDAQLVATHASTESIETEQRNAALIGIFIHNLIEMIAVEGITQWRDRASKDLTDAWWCKLLEMGVSVDQKDSALDKVSRAYKVMLESDTFAWIVNADHCQRKNEWCLSRLYVDAKNDMSANLSVVAAQTIERSVIDCSFIDDEQRRWIIDYKTSQPNQDEQLDSFLAREIDQYRSQLLQYRDWVERYDQRTQQSVREIKLALYFPLIDHLAEF